MILTEAEARTKRCTIFAVAYLLTPLEARNVAVAAGLPMNFTCIGAACAQWRHVAKRIEGAAPVAPEHWGKGYCGLAGAPQIERGV